MLVAEGERTNRPHKIRAAIDFRTGNIMAADCRVTGVLDWEFARWGDPHADLGWLCAPCWRFGNLALEAGGIGPRSEFYSGYEAESKR